MNKWTEKDDRLWRRFEFANFADALAFVDTVGALAEKENHHPDISFGWGYVEVSLYSHSAGKITDKDSALADLIDQTLQ